MDSAALLEHRRALSPSVALRRLECSAFGGMTTNVKATFPFEWRCASCRFEQWVHVRSQGSGDAIISGNGLGSATSNSVDRGLAKMAAQQDAWRAAKMKLALRPCPKCGAIDRRTVVATVVRSLVVSTLVAGGATALLMVKLGFPPWALWTFLASPVQGAAVTAFLWVVRWRPTASDVWVEHQG